MKNDMSEFRKDGLGKYTISNAEYCLIARKGKYWREARNIQQIIEYPKTEHSEKPKESIEKGIKGSPGEFLHQYTSQGIPGSIGDIAAYLTQTGEEYASIDVDLIAKSPAEYGPYQICVARDLLNLDPCKLAISASLDLDTPKYLIIDTILEPFLDVTDWTEFGMFLMASRWPSM